MFSSSTIIALVKLELYDDPIELLWIQRMILTEYLLLEAHFLFYRAMAL